MPIPENNSVVVTGKPVMVGTSSVAPNIAMTCCIPIPMVRGQLSRSSGATTAPSAIRLPSPWTVQPIPPAPVIVSRSITGRNTRGQALGLRPRPTKPVQLIASAAALRAATGSPVASTAAAAASHCAMVTDPTFAPTPATDAAGARQRGNSESGQNTRQQWIGGRLTADADALACRLTGLGRTCDKGEHRGLPRIGQVGEFGGTSRSAAIVY